MTSGRCCPSTTRPASRPSPAGWSALGLRAGGQRRHVQGPGRRGHRPPRGRGGHRRAGDARRPGQDAAPQASTAASSPTAPSPSTWPTSPSRASSPSTSSCATSTRSGPSPSIEMIDIGGPSMVRAAAKNHDAVGVVVDPADYGEVLDELRRDGELSDAHPPPAGPRRLRPHRRVRRRHRRLVRRRRRHAAAADAAPRRSSGPRTCATARTRTRRAPATARSASRSFWDDVEQHSGLALSYLNLYDTDAAWRLVHDLGDGPAVAIIKHANPCGAAVAGDLATAYRLAYEATRSRRSAASSPSTGRRRRHRRGHGRRGPGRRDHRPGLGRRAPSTSSSPGARTRGCSRRPRPAPERLHLRQITGGLLVEEPHHYAATRADWQVVTERAAHRRRVARRRAGVAALRAREVERGRARRRRPGRRHRRRPAEPGRRGRDRDRARRRAGPRAAPAPPTPSIRSATASTPRPRPASPSSSSPAARCATTSSSPPPTSTAWPWSSPARRHFFH